MWNQQEYQVIQIEKPTLGFKEIGLFREHVESLLEQGNHNIILDLSQLNIIGSVGLGALFSLSKQIQKKEGDFKVINASADVLAILRRTKLDEVLEIYNQV